MRLLLLLCSLLSFSAHAQDIRFSRADLQKQIESYMPYTQQQSIFMLTLSDPNLSLLSDEQRIGIRTQFKVTTAIGGEGNGWIHIDGKLRYKSSDHSFYIDAPRVTELNIQGVPAEFKPQLRQLAQDVIAPFLVERPVYTLTGKNMQEALAKMMLKSITIKDNQVIASLGMY